mgnify:CR=1 FL=1
MRAYRIDVQAVCDSLVYNTQDSCMVMYHDPIIWNGNQQLFGEEVRAYMKDSTIHRAHVIGQAFSTEQLHDSVHFNQVSSKEMIAYFNKGEIKEAHAIDNVLVTYFPIEEKDSSLIAMDYTETTLMKLYFDNRKLQRVWAGPSTGTFYPLNQIPESRRFLPGYAWFDYIRPLNKDDIFNWRPKKENHQLAEPVNRGDAKKKQGGREGRKGRKNF